MDQGPALPKSRYYACFIFTNYNMKNISCEYNRWVVGTQLYKLRDTSDTLIGRARAIYVPFVIWCLWITSTIWLLILSSTSFMVGRSRVFYVYSSWKIYVGDSPGCYHGQQDDFARTMLSITMLRTDTNNLHRGRGKTSMVLLHVKQNKTKLSKKCHPYITRIGSGDISYERQFECWWNEQNRCA